jgi:hypothetical protein
MIRVESPQPDDLLACQQMRLGLLRQCHEKRGMRLVDRVGFAARNELFDAIFADGLEHVEAGISFDGRLLAEQALRDQRGYPIEYVDAEIAVHIAHRLGRFE